MKLYSADIVSSMRHQMWTMYIQLELFLYVVLGRNLLIPPIAVGEDNIKWDFSRNRIDRV